MTTSSAAMRTQLLEHAGAMRRLSGALLQSDDADELSQDAAVVAMERGRELRGSHRAWLMGVVRMLARRRWTSASRRGSFRNLDTVAELPSSQPSAQECLEAKECVAKLMCDLEEPYKSTIWLRYYQDRPPREIAELQGCPVATVKTRLQRGLAMLRSRLDTGELRSDWRVGLASTLVSSGTRLALPSTASSGGVTTFVTWVACGVAVAALVALVLGLFEVAPVDQRYQEVGQLTDGELPRERAPSLRGVNGGPPDEVPEVEATSPTFVDLSGALTSEQLVEQLQRERDEEHIAVERASRLREAGARRRILVLDQFDRAVAGAAVQAHVAWKGGMNAGVPVDSAVTDQEGRAALRLAPSHRWILLGHKDGQAAHVEVPKGESDAPLTIRLAAGVTVHGTVADEAGRPIVNAKVEFRNAASAIVGGLEVRSDANGRFQFPPIPQASAPPKGLLRTSRRGYVTTDTFVDVPASPGSGAPTVTLVAAREVLCEVVDEAGRPVPGVRVVTKGDSETTNLEGKAHLERVHPSATTIQLSAVGYAPQEHDIGSSARVDLGRLVLSKGATLEGTVRWTRHKSRPAGRLAVEARRQASGEVLRMAWVAQDGTFKLPSLGNGRYHLTFTTMDRLSPEADYREITIVGPPALYSPGSPAHVTLNASSALGVEFADTSGKLVPTACWSVEVRSSRVPELSLSTGGRKTTGIGGALPSAIADYDVVVVFGEDRRRVETRLHVEAGDVVVLRINPADGAVTQRRMQDGKRR